MHLQARCLQIVGMSSLDKGKSPFTCDGPRGVNQVDTVISISGSVYVDLYVNVLRVK